MTVKTTTGFMWDVDDDARDDQELVDTLIEMDEHPQRYSRVLEILLGKEGKKALYEHCRNDKGRVSATLIQHELFDIFESMKAENSTVKN